MRIATTVALALMFGCASTYYDRYKAEHPNWVPVGPSPGIDVAELVASQTAPPEDPIRELTHKLTIVRTDVDPWEMHELDELASGAFIPSSDADYAVIVSKSCQASVGLDVFQEVQTSWYLLPKNKLLFWDHTEFNTGCVVMTEYVPATLSRGETERGVAAIAARYPKRSTYATHTYRKGIQLAKVGRVEDAEAMLAQGDEELANAESGGQARFEGPETLTVDQPEYRQSMRAQLVEAIATAKSGVRP